MKNFIYMFLGLTLILGLSNCSEVQKKLQMAGFSFGSDPKNEGEPGKAFGFFKTGNDSRVTVANGNQIRGIYLLADGTYSTSIDYVVPRLNTTFLEVLIDKLRHNGGGYIWLSYIDDASKDNECLYLKITTSLITTEKPNFMESGAVNYQKNLKKFEALHSKEMNDSILEVSEMNNRKQKFLDAAYSLLNQKVYLKSYRNKLSDVSGSVQSANKVLTDARRNSMITDCILVGFSDFQNDPDCPALQVDSSVKVFNLISQSGKSKNCISGSQEVMDSDYLLSILKL